MRTTITTAALALALAATGAWADPPASHPTRHYEAHGVLPIHGERQRPQQFNVNGRSASGYTSTETAPRFTPAVVDATRASPF